MSFVPYHQHLIVRCLVKSPIREVAILNKWFADLVEKVGMVVVAGPTSVYVSEEGNEGLTGTVTLATSHASIHIWDAEYPHLVQFDIYSCKCFEVQDVIDHLNVMELLNYQIMTVDRNEGLSVDRISYH